MRSKLLSPTGRWRRCADYERYGAFFKKYYGLLPDDGRMLLHTIVVPTAEEGKELGLKTTMTLLRFISFILKEIYPGGRLPQVDLVDSYSTDAGFKIERRHFIGKNYVPTLTAWGDALEAHKDEAIALKGHGRPTTVCTCTTCTRLGPVP